MTEPVPQPEPRRFATTRWSVVMAAGGDSTQASRTALSELCGTYWYPLYAFARRRGASEHEAQDLVQGFLADLLERESVRHADPERGRFRSFLLKAFQNYVGHQRDRARAQKRGGGKAPLSLDFEDGERRYQLEPVDALTPERVFERRWALTVLGRAVERLRERMASQGRGEWFAVMEPHLAAGTGAPPHAETAERLGMKEGAVKVAVHRLRARYREAIRAEIAETVEGRSAIDAEIRRLMDALTT